jgi:hypothetical protein
MSSISDDNNDAVEHLLLGRPSEAIATLLGALAKSRNTIIVPEPSDDSHTAGPVLYSVEIAYEIPEDAQPALPFSWYGRPIAISASDDDAFDDTAMSFCSPQIAVAVILYNVGVAVQLECANPQLRHKNAPRRSHNHALDAYVMALWALMEVPQLNQPTALESLGDKLGLGLLHVALVNNLLFLYAETVDLVNVSTCLTALSDSLAKLCHGLPREHIEEFAPFLQNTMLFHSTTLGSSFRLFLAPAA